MYIYQSFFFFLLCIQLICATSVQSMKNIAECLPLATQIICKLCMPKNYSYHLSSQPSTKWVRLYLPRWIQIVSFVFIFRLWNNLPMRIISISSQVLYSVQHSVNLHNNYMLMLTSNTAYLCIKDNICLAQTMVCMEGLLFYQDDILHFARTD